MKGSVVFVLRETRERIKMNPDEFTHKTSARPVLHATRFAAHPDDCVIQLIQKMLVD